MGTINTSSNLDILVGSKVKHNVMANFKKSFGSGVIVSVDNNKLSVDFTSVGIKQFSYPIAFINHIVLDEPVTSEIKTMVDADIEVYLSKEKEKLDNIHKLAEIKHHKLNEFSYVALKRPYLDMGVYCSKSQLKSNISAKFTLCQNCSCKECSMDKLDYDTLISSYSESGGCPEALIGINYEFKLSKRNKLTVGDVLLFTYVPSGCKEQERMVYGYGVVDYIVEENSYYIIKLDKEKTYIFDYDSVSNFKFWDVMINNKKPDVMLFGNSHCKKMTDMQMAQYLRMMFEYAEEDEMIARYKDILSYIGISEDEIIKNNGALIKLENDLNDDDEEEEEELESIPRRSTYVRDEDAYDDIDLD